MRIGHGYDAHRFVEGRKCIICGVEVASERGLEGHSDADVAAHALMDALLGAAALGDIGKLFPPSDEKYRNIDSMILLREVVELLKQNGYAIGNVDVTIVAESPRLFSYIVRMRERLAEVMEVDPGCVSVKATTEEGMGFTGAGEGMAAHAVVLIV